MSDPPHLDRGRDERPGRLAALLRALRRRPELALLALLALALHLLVVATAPEPGFFEWLNEQLELIGTG